MERTTIKRFPWGILILLTFILWILSSLVSAGYFYFTSTASIEDIEMETRQSSITLADTLAGIAELSFKKNDYRHISRILKQKIGETKSTEAFFALSNGKIVAHSNPALEKKLKGNIANDEFSYNLDQILLPIHKKTSDVIFQDYNIMNISVPYAGYEKYFLKNYIYHSIDRVGWLATRAVFHKTQPVGTVNLIISKSRIYNLIDNLKRQSIIAAGILGACSLLISLFTSIVVFLRYSHKKNNKKVKKTKSYNRISSETETLDSLNIAELNEITDEDSNDFVPQKIKDAIPIAK